MKKSLRVVFFGNERIATGISAKPKLFESLLKSRHKVVGLVVHTSETSSRTKRTEPIVESATSHDIPVINPVKLSESIDEIRAFGADIGVLVAYGKIIPQSVIDLFPHGIINLHPSLLPELRGPTPVETAILQGRTETGVSVMKLVKEMDAGPVLAQKAVQIETHDIEKQELADYLHHVGAELVMEQLDHIANEKKLVENLQEDSLATYSTIIHKSDGPIDWNKPAEYIERQIRAYSGWPKSRTVISNLNVSVTHAHVSGYESSFNIGDYFVVPLPNGNKMSEAIAFKTSDKCLVITALQPENKKEMPVWAFLNGYKDKLGL